MAQMAAGRIVGPGLEAEDGLEGLATHDDGVHGGDELVIAIPISPSAKPRAVLLLNSPATNRAGPQTSKSRYTYSSSE
jgi:hypothetical protein